jgi:hypothetical protein
MGFTRCGRDDPFTSQVRLLYHANVLRVPRAGVDPLDVLAVKKRWVEHRGRLPGLIAGGTDLGLPAPATYRVSDLDGVRSAALDVNVGAKLTATFLQALGLPVPGAELEAALWSSTSAVGFEVREVSEHRVDLGLLGVAMAGRQLADNPATGIFLTDKAVRMLVVTRVLTSSNFAVRASARAGQSVKASVDAIENLLGKTTTADSWKRESEQTISFGGDTAVTFAFGAVPCAVQPNRSIIFGTEVDRLTFGDTAAAPQVEPVVDEDGLLDLDEPDGG